jgi:nucleoside-diphosphate-sugar epimerase
MILITGANGFIGSYVFDYFRSKELPCATTSFRRFCVSHKINITGVSDFNILVICSGLAHDRNNNIQSMIGQYLDINLYKLLKFCKQINHYSRLKRIIFLSSVNVKNYSSCNIRNFSSNYVDNNALSKFIFENALKEFGIVNDIEITIIRSPLVYGQGVKANFSALLNLVTKKLPLPFGAIDKNRRSLVSIYNLVDLINTCISHPNAANQTFLVSDDNDLSTTQMVKLMAKVQGVKPLLIPIPVSMLKFLGNITGTSAMISRLTDSLQVDITHTKNTLNWSPPYSVEEGFKMSVQKPIKNNEKVEK